jgi:hypothetical protein
MGITIAQLFYGAFRDAGIVKVDQTILSGDQNEECRQVYNRFVDQLAADGFTVSHVARVLFNIIPNQGDYLIGPGGDFDVTPAPNQIERASILLTATSPTTPPEYTLSPLTIDEWQQWTLKTQVTNFSRRFYYERPGSIPPTGQSLNSVPPNPGGIPTLGGGNPGLMGILHLLYVPNAANQVVLYLEQPLSQIDAMGDAQLFYPAGYQMMIESNLAVQLAARYPNEQQLSQDTRANAIKSLALIKMNNDRPLQRSCDWVAGQRRSNVYDGNRYQR